MKCAKAAALGVVVMGVETVGVAVGASCDADVVPAGLALSTSHCVLVCDVLSCHSEFVPRVSWAHDALTSSSLTCPFPLLLCPRPAPFFSASLRARGGPSCPGRAGRRNTYMWPPQAGAWQCNVATWAWAVVVVCAGPVTRR